MGSKGWVKGDFLRIDLGNGSFAFARVLDFPLVLFYDALAEKRLSINEIVASRELFKIWVMKSAFSSKKWEVIGNSPLDASLFESPVFFKVDPISKKYSLYQGGAEVLACREQCEGLERAAVWDPVHVEDRLRDYFNGVPNKWVESLRLPIK